MSLPLLMPGKMLVLEDPQQVKNDIFQEDLSAYINETTSQLKKMALALLQDYNPKGEDVLLLPHEDWGDVPEILRQTGLRVLTCLEKIETRETNNPSGIYVTDSSKKLPILKFSGSVTKLLPYSIFTISPFTFKAISSGGGDYSIHESCATANTSLIPNLDDQLYIRQAEDMRGHQSLDMANSLSPTEIVHCIYTAAIGLKNDFHETGKMHNDFKTPNIFVANDSDQTTPAYGILFDHDSTCSLDEISTNLSLLQCDHYYAHCHLETILPILSLNSLYAGTNDDRFSIGISLLLAFSESHFEQDFILKWERIQKNYLLSNYNTIINKEVLQERLSSDTIPAGSNTHENYSEFKEKLYKIVSLKEWQKLFEPLIRSFYKKHCKDDLPPELLELLIDILNLEREYRPSLQEIIDRLRDMFGFMTEEELSELIKQKPRNDHTT